jgi:hypothetical protein
MAVDLTPKRFVPVKPKDRPQDPSGDAVGWTFKTLEHDDMSMPRAIRATDPQGRSCVYVTIENGDRLWYYPEEG